MDVQQLRDIAAELLPLAAEWESVGGEEEVGLTVNDGKVILIDRVEYDKMCLHMLTCVCLPVV